MKSNQEMKGAGAPLPTPPFPTVAAGVDVRYWQILTNSGSGRQIFLQTNLSALPQKRTRDRVRFRLGAGDHGEKITSVVDGVPFVADWSQSIDWKKEAEKLDGRKMERPDAWSTLSRKIPPFVGWRIAERH